MSINSSNYNYFIPKFFTSRNWNKIEEYNLFYRYFSLLQKWGWLTDKEKIWWCLWVGIFWHSELNKGFSTISDSFNQTFITPTGQFIYDYVTLKDHINNDFDLAEFIPSSHVFQIWENIDDKKWALLSIAEYFCRNIDDIVLDFNSDNFLSLANRIMHTTSHDWKISKFKGTYTIDCARIMYISFPELLKKDCFLDLYYLFNRASRNVKKMTL